MSFWVQIDDQSRYESIANKKKEEQEIIKSANRQLKDAVYTFESIFKTKPDNATITKLPKRYNSFAEIKIEKDGREFKYIETPHALYGFGSDFPTAFEHGHFGFAYKGLSFENLAEFGSILMAIESNKS